MSESPLLERLGFDVDRLNYTLRTAVAACFALALAWLVGLEHPQWSGMTVWAASQPMRGQLLEKSLFRIVGTIIGSLFGIFVVIIARGESWVIVIGLSVWVGLCAGIANLMRGFVSYGFMLAGYSAAMVALLQSQSGGSDVAIGIDRMLTVLLGVIMALAVGWMFAQRADRDGLAQRVRRLSSRIFADLAAHLSGTMPGERHEHKLLLEMAAIDDELDGHGAGSLRSRQAARALRRLLSAQVATLLWMRRAHRPTHRASLIEALREVASALEGEKPERLDTALRRVVALAEPDRALKDVLAGLAQAITGQRTADAKGVESVEPLHPVVLHRDWIGAREAMLRAGGATLAVGLLWLATGWSAGAFMMLGTAIMVTIFSTAENPVQTMRLVVIGQIVGAAGALACRWLVWPLATGETGLILSTVPFILFGGLIFAHRRTVTIGFDYNMVLLLLLQPTWPLAGSLFASLTAAGAVVLGPLIALLSYRLVFPIDGPKRLRTLITMMVQEIEAMAAQPEASRRRLIWRARLYHRVLRLVRWAEKAGKSKQQVIEGSFAVLLLGGAILHMDELQGEPGQSAGTVRRLKLARARLCTVGDDPLRTARTLTNVVSGLADDARVDHSLLREAASALMNQSSFFRTARAAWR